MGATPEAARPDAPVASSHMQTTEVTHVSQNGFARKIHALVPAIRERREEIEAARRLPADLVGSLVDAGVFALGVPRALGGVEADPMDQLRVIETLAHADGSTGWCAMLGINTGIVAGYMPEAGAKEVFADPTAPTALVAAPLGRATRVDGGIRLTGRWPFASGVTHAGWVVAGSFVFEGDAPRMTEHGPEWLLSFLRADQITIHDTWHVSGLRGTGSNDFSADDVFVPDERAFSVGDPTAFRPEPLYQIPVLALVAAHIASVAVGVARAALDELTELATTKVPSMNMSRMADKPVTQVELARAEGALGAARAFLHDTLDDAWQTASSGTRPSRRQTTMCRIAANHAVEAASLAARTAATLTGGSSLYDHSTLQRHIRDVEAITHHVAVSPQQWEEAGRTLLGHEPHFPLF